MGLLNLDFMQNTRKQMNRRTELNSKDLPTKDQKHQNDVNVNILVCT